MANTLDLKVGLKVDHFIMWWFVLAPAVMIPMVGLIRFGFSGKFLLLLVGGALVGLIFYALFSPVRKNFTRRKTAYEQGAVCSITLLAVHKGLWATRKYIVNTFVFSVQYQGESFEYRITDLSGLMKSQLQIGETTPAFYHKPSHSLFVPEEVGTNLKSLQLA